MAIDNSGNNSVRTPLIWLGAGGALLTAGMVARKLLSRERRPPAFARGILVKKAILVNKPPEECYRYWRNLENLPFFLSHIESVEVKDKWRSHWEATVGSGHSIGWDAEILSDVENEMIGWRSLPGSGVDTAGSVRFERTRIPGGRGTTVRVTLKYNPPGGALGAAVMRALGAQPDRQIEDDLARFKRIVESTPYPPSRDTFRDRAAFARA